MLDYRVLSFLSLFYFAHHWRLAGWLQATFFLEGNLSLLYAIYNQGQCEANSSLHVRIDRTPFPFPPALLPSSQY